MEVSGIRPVAGINDYKITKESEIEKFVAQQTQLKQTQQQEQMQQTSENTVVQAGNKSQTEDAFSYAQKYEPNKTYEMKGAESSLESLDMERAISDMKKDELLRQYQFFVGTSQGGKNPLSGSGLYAYENFEI